MKILISESQYDILLNELLLLTKDIERMKQHGDELIEELNFGPFILVLTHNKIQGYYQVGLTSTDKEFTTPDSQKDLKSDKSQNDIIKAWKQIVNKIQDWVNTYGLLFIGSFNHGKVKKYHKILNTFGINVGDINTGHMGSWFNIKK